MTPHTFVLILVLASMVFAVWAAVRFPDAGPSTLGSAVLQVLCGFAAIRAISGLTDAMTALSSGAAVYVAPFAIALPLFTYGFLTGLWAVRFIHRSLSGLPS